MKKANDISIIRDSFNSIENKAPENVWSMLDNRLNQIHPIDAKIKDSFSGHAEVTFPVPFSQIVSRTGSNVDDSVKSSFEEYKVAAPEFLWNKIDAQLETDKVWLKMNNKIVVKSQKWKTIIAAASITLLMSLLPNFVREGIGSGEFTLFEILEQTTVETAKLTNSEIKLKHEPNGNIIFVEPEIDFTKEQPELKSIPLIKDESFTNSDLVNRLDFSQVQKVAVDYSFEFDLVPQTELIEQTKQPKKFSVGITGGLNRTWVIDNETRLSFDKNSLIESKFVVGSSYGLTAQLDLNHRSFITANIFNSTSRNKIANFEEGNYGHKVSEIEFSQISVLYGLSFLHSPNRKWNFVSKLGGYFGMVRNSLTRENNTLTSLNDNYKKLDYGVVAQVAPQFQKGNFAFEIGVNYELGFRNLFAGNGLVSSHLNYTNNTELGLYFTLRYKLTK